MVDGLDRLLSLPDGELSRIAEAGRDLVVREYDSAGYPAQILALLRESSSGQRPGGA